MVRDGYVPGRGDLIWLTFRPQAGREQSGRRPALVLSPVDYNGRAGLAVVCPVTSRVKGYPFEVPVPEGGAITGVVLADHLKSVDWRARGTEYADGAPDAVMAEVSAKVRVLLGL